MSMEDILKALVNSRQQQSSQTQQSADPMAELLGSLLGGQPTTSSSSQSSQSAGGLDDMLSLLEIFMGNNKQSNSMTQMASNPIMSLLQPFVDKLAKKMNISTDIAMMVVSFVVYKLLSQHNSTSTSGSTSTSSASSGFDLDDLLKQMSTGKIDTNVLQTSGMVNELSRSTGLDQATAAKSLETAFSMFGKPVKAGMTSSKGTTKRVPTTTTRKSPVSGNKLQRAGVKGGAVRKNR